VDSRNQTETDQCREGNADPRHEPGPAPGRALRTQAVKRDGAERESVAVDRLTSIETNAASSSRVGSPRTTLTSASSSIERAYDEP
jgi:hypothetical protein